MSKMRIIGLMSGTSLDGLDLIDVTIWKQADLLKFRINNTSSVPYSNEEQNKLKNSFHNSPEKVQETSVSYGKYLGNAVKKFLDDFSIEDVDFIASHGHTVFHKPSEGITVQIGDGQTLSNTCGIDVICDFRTQDVELGGQGAPLVPIGDELLFGEYEYCLNLGGFANVSFDENGSRLAFDICPINIVLNHYTRKIGLEFDDGGTIARQGMLNNELLEALNSLSFYSQPFPKSLGYEFVVEQVIPLVDSMENDIPNILRTVIEHAAIQITNNFTKSNGIVLVTGGGAFNSFLLERMKDLTNLLIETPSKEIIEFKEALIFALLGYLKSKNQINVLSSVTGASKDHSSGKIYKPKTSI